MGRWMAEACDSALHYGQHSLTSKQGFLRKLGASRYKPQTLANMFSLFDICLVYRLKYVRNDVTGWH